MFIKTMLTYLLLFLSVQNTSVETTNIDLVTSQQTYKYYNVNSDTYETIIEEVYLTSETNKTLKYEVLNNVLIENKVITEDIVFNNFSITAGVGYLDMNKTLDNLGSGFESATLEAIQKTFLENYDIHDIVITINNNIYESGHILLD